MANWQAELKAAFVDSFMKPECFRGGDIESEVLDAGLDLESDKVYARLSASGYLDCTDWSGPFDTPRDAATYLIETYAD